MKDTYRVCMLSQLLLCFIYRIADWVSKLLPRWNSVRLHSRECVTHACTDIRSFFASFFFSALPVGVLPRFKANMYSREGERS